MPYPTPTLGGMGYQYFVKVEHMDSEGSPITEYQIPVTSEGFARARTELATAGAAGDNFNKVGSAYIYDFDRFEGSIGFDLLPSMWGLIDDVLLDYTKRDAPFRVTVSTGEDETFVYYPAYWTTFSMNASEGANVACELGFVSFARAVTSDNSKSYILDRSRVGLSTYDGFDGDEQCIAFWNTKITNAEFDPYEIIAWDFSLENNVAEFVTCQSELMSTSPSLNAGDASIPVVEVPGRATVAFNSTLYGRHTDADSVSLSDQISEIDIVIGKPMFNSGTNLPLVHTQRIDGAFFIELGTIKIYDVEINNFSKNFEGKNSALTFQVSYDAFGSFPSATTA